MRKYQTNSNLWFEFFSYLNKNKSNNTLNQEIGLCLKKNPSNIDFWKFAAYHEIENNRDYTSARQVFQKCLRLNPKSLKAYLEYFILELGFIENTIKRRKYLIGKDKNPEDKLEFLDENNNEINEKDNDNNDEVLNELLDDEVLNLQIPKIIFYQALEKLSNSNNSNNDYSLYEVASSFYRELCLFTNKLENKEKELKEEIYNILVKANTNFNSNNANNTIENNNNMVIESDNDIIFNNNKEVFILECQALEGKNLIIIVKNIDKYFTSKFDLNKEYSDEKKIELINVLLKGYNSIITKVSDKKSNSELKTIVKSIIINSSVLKRLLEKQEDLLINNLDNPNVHEIFECIISYLEEYHFICNANNTNSNDDNSDIITKILDKLFKLTSNTNNNQSEVSSKISVLNNYYNLFYLHYVINNNNDSEEFNKQFLFNKYNTVNNKDNKDNNISNAFLLKTKEGVSYIINITNKILLYSTKHDIFSLINFIKIIIKTFITDDKVFKFNSKQVILDFQKQIVNSLLLFMIKYILSFTNIDSLSVNETYFNQIKQELIKIKQYTEKKLISFSYLISNVIVDIENSFSSSNNKLLIKKILEKVKKKITGL